MSKAMSNSLAPRLSGKNKDNAFVSTVKFIKKEVGSVETKIKAEAREIAIRNALFGGAIGVVLGIVGTSLWQKYVTPPASPAAAPQRPTA